MKTTDPTLTTWTSKMREMLGELSEHCSPELTLSLSRLLAERLPHDARRWLPSESNRSEDAETPDASIGFATFVETARLANPIAATPMGEEQALRICEAYLSIVAEDLPPEAWIELKSLLPAELRHRFVPRAAKA